MRVLLFAIVFLVGCDDASRRIEGELKTDRSRPGYVGVSRALEVIGSAHDVSDNARCPSPIRERGTWISELSVSYLVRDRSRKNYVTSRTFSSDGTDAHLFQETKTVDARGIDSTRTKSWWFVGGKTMVQESISAGKIAGEREPTHDELDRMRGAALAGWDFVTMFDDIQKDACRIPKRDSISILSSVRGVETTVDERDDTKGKIVRTVSVGDMKSLKIRYSFSQVPEVAIAPLPVVEARPPLREPIKEKQIVKELREQGVLK